MYGGGDECISLYTPPSPPHPPYMDGGWRYTEDIIKMEPIIDGHIRYESRPASP